MYDAYMIAAAPNARAAAMVMIAYVPRIVVTMDGILEKRRHPPYTYCVNYAVVIDAVASGIAAIAFNVRWYMRRADAIFIVSQIPDINSNPPAG